MVVVAVAEGTGVEGSVVLGVVPGVQILLPSFLYMDRRQDCPHISAESPAQGLLQSPSGTAYPPFPTYELPQ